MSTSEKGTKGNRRILDALLGKNGDPVRSEREQAVLRLVIVSLTMLYLFGLRDPELHARIGERDLFGFLAFILCVAAGIYVSTWIVPRPSRARRIFGIFADCIGFSVALYLAEGAGAPWFGVYLWVIFGNTLRYGSVYLYLSTAFSVIGFGGVLLFSQYWRGHIELGIGLLVTLIVLPAYAAALAQRLRNAQLAAEAASRAKSQFLANMSHEIRTPLNGIIGAAELLSERDLAREDRHLVGIINRSGNVLLELVNNILDLSKIEANRLVCEQAPFDLHQFMNTVADMMSVQAEKKDLRLMCSVDPRIPHRLKGDENHLKQVMVNLVGNGIKFTSRGEVELRCMLAESDEGGVRVRFSVRDTGIGIPPEQQEKIMEPFVQADNSTSRQYGGTGLGTAIARELVELMGGSLGLESVPGEGTTFSFTIPLELDADAALPEQLPIAGRSVLALFSGAGAGRRWVERLQEWSLDVLEARDTGSAERLLRQAFFDYSPVEAVVVQADLAGEAERALRRWHREGLVGERLPFIVVDEAADRLPPEARVLDRRMHVASELELFRALHSVALPAAPDEDIFTETREQSVPLNILLADDNATNRLILASMLRNAGHRVTETASGEAFLEAVESEDYDLALLDMHMPDMTGLEVYQAYRFAHAGEEGIPFIMVTADVTEAARAACREAGIEHVLTKPVSAVQLFRTIEELGIGASHVALDPGNAVSAVPPEEVPLVDDEKVAELMALDAGTELAARILECFGEDVEAMLAQLRRALQSRDHFTAREVAHALRGSAGNVGLARLQLLAEQFEQMDERTFFARGAERLEQLEGVVRESVAVLATRLGLRKPRPRLRVVS